MIILSNLRTLIEFMKYMCRILLVLLITFAVSYDLSGQNYFFAEARENEIAANAAGKRVIIPERYRSLVLDIRGMQDFLKTLSHKSGVAGRSTSAILELPMPEGGRASYRIWESPVMEPALAERFPGIKTYTGQGINDSTATIKIDFTELGFHAMVLSDVNEDIFIDPYRQQDSRNYVAYNKRDFKKKRPFSEIDVIEPSDRRPPTGNKPMAGICTGEELHSYRLAVACTGEYARAATGISNPTVGQALSAIVTSVNRVDGIYEREVAISLNLVSNNNLIVFVNPSTDPFSANDDGSALLDESQTVINANIGTANYDIGHTFSTGAGGIAQISSVCGPQKARGVTGSPDPVGDPYDIDYFAHEMGHQFGASHSFNATTSSCSGNRNGPTAVEPGSGITIMAYTGICGATNNLANNSIAYFHAASMEEINTFTTIGGGATCGTIAVTGNIVPVVNAGNNFTIPKSTPFVLTGSATDGNGDPLTYSWEQMDVGPAGNWNTPTGNAPIFRSFEPVTAPVRYFPKLSDQINNTTTIGEILPSYGRSMVFRLTARDNRAGGGGVCADDISVLVDALSGPFTVTAPSGTGISWPGGSNQIVTWNVANTNGSAVNCANVSIQLSTDGGLTFPITILASTPNDGSQEIVVPDNVTSQARIRVMAVGNVFYDMSNNNFTITPAQPGFDFTVPAPANVNCSDPDPTSVTLGTVSILGYTTPITLSATGNPPGTSVTFSSPTVVPGNNVVVTLNNTGLLHFDSSYTVTVTGVSGTLTRTRDLIFTILKGAGPVISQQPVSQQVCSGADITFNVASADPVVAYQWQFSNNNGLNFNNITGAVSSSYTITNAEEAQNNFRYRVLLRGQCNVTTSNAATLTVYTLPEVVLTPTLTSIVPGETSTLTATITAGSDPNVVTTWTRDGNVFDVTGNTYEVNVTNLGNYKVLVSDDNGCTNESAVITIAGKASSGLYLYPNPNNGNFTVSYYNAGGGSTKQSVTIYDSKGAKVYYKEFSFSGFYGLHNVEIGAKQRGIYIVVIGDAGGKKIVEGKVLIN